MKIKRFSPIFCLALLFLLGSNIGCKNSRPEIVENDKKIIMKIGHTQPITHPRHQSLVLFKKIVEEKTANLIEVQIYPAAQLGSDDEQMKMLKIGSLQGLRGNQLEAAAPQLLIYTMPFLFNNIEEAHKITRGPIGKYIADFAQKNNIIILATGDVGGLRNFTNNVRPIAKPADLENIIIRTPPIESTTKILEALGAKTKPVAYDSLYTALKNGEVEGQENPLINISVLKLGEVQKYFSLTQHQYMPDPFFVNLQWYNSLGTDLQQIVREASIEMMLYSDDMIKEDEKHVLENLQKSMAINKLSHEESKLFVEQTKSVYDYYLDKKVFSAKDLEKIREAIAQP